MYALIGSDVRLPLVDFTINIDSTPLDSTDSTGGVGDFTLITNTPEEPYSLSLENLIDREIAVYDSDGWASTPNGVLLGGRVSNIVEQDGVGFTISGELELGGLNVRNVVMPPFYGTLEDLIELYLDTRLKSGTQISVHPDIADRTMTVPGWRGELWYHIKMLCAAESVEFVYPSSGQAELRPTRRIEGRTLTASDLSRTTDAAEVAQYIEVKEYNSVWVDDKLFYPPGGWSEDVEIISVNEGETVEFSLELEGSVQTIQQPTMVTNVSRDHVSSSVYSVVGDDGFPIQPAMWNDFGGDVRLEVGDDTRHLILTVTAPEGLHKDNGEPMQSFSLAMASGDTSPRYSSLRIVGSGVWFSNDDPLKIPTGVEAAETDEFELGEEVGATIDNPFLATRAHVASAVYRAALKFIGYNSTISGIVQRLSDAGTFMEDAGARVFYDTRPYRTRSATYTPNGVQFTAEDDLSISDMEALLGGLTVGQVQERFEGLTVKEVQIEGYKI